MQWEKWNVKEKHEKTVVTKREREKCNVNRCEKKKDENRGKKRDYGKNV